MTIPSFDIHAVPGKLDVRTTLLKSVADNPKSWVVYSAIAIPVTACCHQKPMSTCGKNVEDSTLPAGDSSKAGNIDNVSQARPGTWRNSLIGNLKET